MKVPIWLLILVVALILVALYLKSRQTCYSLPTTKDPDKFGPYYWRAFHDLANRVPCPSCREEAVSFLKFFHDWINLKLNKKIMYQENFDAWVNKISTLKTT